MAAQRLLGSIVLAGALLALAACGTSPDPTTASDALGDDAITVASFDFPESELLAQIYGQALQRAGFHVRFELRLGPRELVSPALARGLVEFVPEYAGTAVQYLSLGTVASPADVVAAHRNLERQLRDRELVALDPAPAQDANAIVVTGATADRLGLETISDLQGAAPGLVFGGPPECPSRPFCLQGLTETYGLEFEAFIPLDTGGPLTRQALETGQVDVGLLFTTDPNVTGEGLVALADDRSLQPAENVTPVVHRAVVERWGAPFVASVDAVSARLTTSTLRRLNAEVSTGRPAANVAASWLTAEDLP